MSVHATGGVQVMSPTVEKTENGSSPVLRSPVGLSYDSACGRQTLCLESLERRREPVKLGQDIDRP